ncbi:hypothetical protein GCM10011579_051390 [Streptomyces albiflavescens]|uniref:Uncharacterized protein n=1 Tax=Streptomyces albiflavescens TaxID=1623582 RepID=A0A917Y8J6_9ACTN|nr:hypothetical protein [Streptomyces albiflavescens]GGN73329.1 hypothetical protein GCM10011579_051390 [Streptomyces albiflavescens]
MDPITAAAAAGVALVVKGVLESAAQEAGRSGWSGGARIIERVRARFRDDTAAEGALERVEQSPEDEAAQAQLQRTLLAHMLRDPDFEADIRRIVDETVAAQGGKAQVNAALIKNAQVFNEKVEIQGDWNIS